MPHHFFNYLNLAVFGAPFLRKRVLYSSIFLGGHVKIACGFIFLKAPAPTFLFVSCGDLIDIFFNLLHP